MFPYEREHIARLQAMNSGRAIHCPHALDDVPISGVPNNKPTSRISPREALERKIGRAAAISLHDGLIIEGNIVGIFPDKMIVNDFQLGRVSVSQDEIEGITIFSH